MTVDADTEAGLRQQLDAAADLASRAA